VDWLTERVENHEQVHADNGEDGVAVQDAIGRVHRAVHPDVVHAERLAHRSDNQRPLAPQLLSKRHQTDGRHDYLYHPIDAHREQSRRRSDETNLLENLRGVVVYRIGACPLLPEHEDDAKGSTVEHLFAGSSSSDLGHQWHLFVAVEVLDDLVEFLNHPGIVSWLAANPRKSLGRVGNAVLLDEPAWAFVHEEHSDEEAASRQHLESKRDPPFSFIRRIRNVEVDAVVDKERKTYARNVEELLPVVRPCPQSASLPHSPCTQYTSPESPWAHSPQYTSESPH
jgi:hypothetical protein